MWVFFFSFKYNISSLKGSESSGQAGKLKALNADIEVNQYHVLCVPHLENRNNLFLYEFMQRMNAPLLSLFPRLGHAHECVM